MIRRRHAIRGVKIDDERRVVDKDQRVLDTALRTLVEVLQAEAKRRNPASEAHGAEEPPPADYLTQLPQAA